MMPQKRPASGTTSRPSAPAAAIEQAVAPAPESAPDATPAGQRNFLHVGCGNARAERLPSCFRLPAWREVRLDIDAAVAPDIVASMTDMPAVPDGIFDAIWSSHNLEHLHSFEVPLALAEFRRVLRSDGFVLINLPDLRAIARHILADNLANPLYQAEAGVITPLDVLFGHQGSLKKGHDYMAHRTGFTANTLGKSLLDAGFAEVRVVEGNRWDLWALALMPDTPAALLDELAGVMR